MSTRLLAEQPSVAELEEALKEVTDLPHCHNKDVIYRLLAEHIDSTVQPALERAADTAAAAASDQLIVPATITAKELTESLDASEKALANLISQVRDDSSGTLSASRIKAITEFNDSLRVVTEVHKALVKHDKTIKTISTKLEDLYTNQDCTNPSIGDEIKRLHKLRQNIESERTHKTRKILEHFNDTIRPSTDKRLTSDLIIPNHLDHGRGQELADNMYAYLKNRADEYYVILPYLYRISEDYDATIGSFYKPPDKHDGYQGVDPALVNLYAKQAQALYTEMNMRTPKELMTRIKSTFKYGLHEQLTGRCEENDGPTAYFSLLSLYRPSSAAYRDALIERFNIAHTHFYTGDPKTKVKDLRKPLVEVIKLQVPLSWSSTGKKIIGVLSRRDHVMSQAIKQYERGPDKPENAAIHLQDLFSAIEVEADKITGLGGKVLDDTTWHANHTQGYQNSHQHSYNKDTDRECRYGNQCRNRHCLFRHPDQQLRSEPRQSAHRCNCAARGCSRYTRYRDDLFCDSCLKQAKRTGNITMRDGSEHKLKPARKRDSESLYGFTKQQLEGLRLLCGSIPLSANSAVHELPDERPAPASVKRRRMQEHAHANSATANNQDAESYQHQQFLDELFTRN